MDGLYQFSPSHVALPQACHAHSPASVSALTWHQRLGHPSPLKFQHIIKHLPYFSSDHIDCSTTCNKIASCTNCVVAKIHRLPFKLSNTSVNALFSLVHSDI